MSSLFERQMLIHLLMKVEDRSKVASIMDVVFDRYYSSGQLDAIRIPEKSPYNHVMWGYASMYGADLSGDDILPGAYTFPDDITPIVFGHDNSHPIGAALLRRPDEFGLMVAGWLKSPPIQNGLSIGFVTEKFEKKHRGRILEKIVIHHIGVVRNPMNISCRFNYI